MSESRTEQRSLPERIAGLAGLARNLGWSWDGEARALFRFIDETLWHLTQHDPLALLRRVDPARLAACAANPDFVRIYDALIEKTARQASDQDTWFATTYPELRGQPVAYFGADLLGRIGDPRGGSLQRGIRSGRADHRGRAPLYARVFRPAAPAGRLAGGRRPDVR